MTEIAETAVRARTRSAVLDAAAQVWARDFHAPLGDVAAAARVSRSTLRRYFPDRESLVEALRVESSALLLDAAARADADGPDVLASLERLVRLAVDHHDRVLFLFSDPNRFPDESDRSGGDRTLVGLVESAQARGLIHTGFDPRWVQSIFYFVVHAAAESIADGYLTPSEAADAAVRTLLRGVRGDAAP